MIDDETIDFSIIKGDIKKNYQQQRARLNHTDQNLEITFGGNNKYCKLSIAFYQ